MSKDNAKGGARPSQPETVLSEAACDGSNAVWVARMIGGGLLPREGEYSLTVWAILLGRTEAYVLKEFDEADLPYRKFGHTLRYYDAVHVRGAMPVMRSSEDPDRQGRGGNRKKRE